MLFRTQRQPKTTGGFLSSSTRTPRSSRHHHHRHHHHQHGLGLGTAGATTTRRSPGGVGLFGHRSRAPRTTRTTRRTGGGLFGGSRRTKKSSVLPIATTTVRRRPTLGDRISGAFLKLKGSITGRPREKAIGDRRMHGTSRRRLRRQPGQHFY